MSAWIVSRNHIDQLVAGAIRLGLVAQEDATKVGRMLTNANRRSIRDRYGEYDRSYLHSVKEGAYWYRTPRQTVDDVSLYKQLNCYDYQTSEIWNYERTTASRFVRRMARALEALGVSRDSEGYNEAPWGV